MWFWFSVVCTLDDNDTRHYSGQNVVDSRGVSLSIRVQATLNHISICFLPQYRSQRNFFSKREMKRALRDTLTRAALSGQRQINQLDCEISSNCGKKKMQ